MPIYAQADDVADRWGQAIPQDRVAWVEQQIDDAEEHIADRVGPIADRIAAGRTTAARVEIVVCDMVLRVLKNPSGWRQQSVGPFNHTTDREVSSGRLMLTRNDKRLLGIRVGATSVPMVDETLADIGRRSPSDDDR